MKEFAVWAVLLVALVGCEDGSYFHPDTQQIKSDAVARINATGEDFRLYEFTPQTAPDMQCIFVAATQKGGVFCFPKLRPHPTTGIPK